MIRVIYLGPTGPLRHKQEAGKTGLGHGPRFSSSTLHNTGIVNEGLCRKGLG